MFRDFLDDNNICARSYRTFQNFKEVASFSAFSSWSWFVTTWKSNHVEMLHELEGLVPSLETSNLITRTTSTSTSTSTTTTSHHEPTSMKHYWFGSGLAWLVLVAVPVQLRVAQIPWFHRNKKCKRVPSRRYNVFNCFVLKAWKIHVGIFSTLLLTIQTENKSQFAKGQTTMKLSIITFLACLASPAVGRLSRVGMHNEATDEILPVRKLESSNKQ